MDDDKNPTIGVDGEPIPESVTVDGPPAVRLLWPLALIGVIWAASDLGYYLLLPVFGLQSNYNEASVAVSLYYVFWIGIAIITFWPVYSSWPIYGNWTTFENRLASYLVWCVSFGFCALFAAYILPQLPTLTWNESWSPPAIRVATPSYFLPKSIEILFQQMLVAAMVLTLAEQRLSLRTISIVCALVFGASHILLAFSGVPTGYVIRFMASATLFGLAFPFLLLRVRNGLAYSYMVHWTYYAASVLLPHLFSSPVK